MYKFTKCTTDDKIQYNRKEISIFSTTTRNRNTHRSNEIREIEFATKKCRFLLKRKKKPIRKTNQI